MPATMQAKVQGLLEKPTVHPSDVQTAFTVLLISASFETRRIISKVLEALSVQVVSGSTLLQARQALSVQRPNLIFCDERLADGSYADVLTMDYDGRIPPPLVVLTRTGEWEFYMDATRRGAFDVIRSPWCPTDIELSLIRAAREEKQNAGRTARPASLA